MVAKEADALGGALGIESARDVRYQDALAWEQLTARAAWSPLVQSSQKALTDVPQSLPTPPPVGRRVQPLR